MYNESALVKQLTRERNEAQQDLKTAHKQIFGFQDTIKELQRQLGTERTKAGRRAREIALLQRENQELREQLAEAMMPKPFLKRLFGGTQ